MLNLDRTSRSNVVFVLLFSFLEVDFCLLTSLCTFLKNRSSSFANEMLTLFFFPERQISSLLSVVLA